MISITMRKFLLEEDKRELEEVVGGGWSEILAKSNGAD